MFKRYLFQTFQYLPLAQKIAAICAAVCLISTVVLILASYQGDRQLIQHSSQLFGDSLAQQLSRDASNPLVQGDKLSLQSLLNKIIESPLVVRGAIYDVENHPIAEAGTQNSNGQSLSASITFQDSIAGYLVITLDTTPLQQQAKKQAWQLGGLAILLSALIYAVSLVPARYLSAAIRDLSAIASTPDNQRKTNSHIGYFGEDELQELAKQIINGPFIGSAISEQYSGHAVLAIQISNLDELGQQHTAAQLARLLSDFHRQLKMICKLYDGELQINRSNGFCIRFRPDEDEHSYPFRALCSGHLITQWALQLPVSIRAGLALQNPITSRTTTNTIELQLQQQQAIERAIKLAESDDKLVVEATLYEHSSVQSRVIANSPDGYRITGDITDETTEAVVIEKLSEPYGALLQRQLSTLCTQFER